MEDDMDVDLAFLPPESLLRPVATPVVALACPCPQVVPADLPTPSAGPRSTTWSRSRILAEWLYAGQVEPGRANILTFTIYLKQLARRGCAPVTLCRVQLVLPFKPMALSAHGREATRFPVVENGVVMALICLDQSLKTAKYIAVFNLAFVDVFGNSALVPKVIDTFWFKRKYITYNNCLTYEFFNYMILTMQSLNLVLLSFDRLVAITFPLRYHVIVSLKTMFLLVAFFWIFAIFVNLIAVGLLTRLSFCSYFVQLFLGDPQASRET
ncbi:Olfactory receptor 8A1 [Merluccius polli]|uniref:Olfactory receptor 8A1 n=1 Tax=Merluccius polli TaxID=89951 RepID=A0AA47MMK2_MERPO|nr:Olfactory receptor 8A1 [Merluccius polli]